MIPPYSVKACPEKEAHELETLVGVAVSPVRLSENTGKKYASELLEREILSNVIDITDIEVKTIFAEDKRAEILLSFKTSEPCDIKVYLAPAWPKKDKERLIGEFFSEGELCEKITLESINLWSAETPELYDIRIVADDCDDRVVETGFRTIENKNGELLLNGKKYCIKGAFIDEKKRYGLSDWQIIWHYLMIKRMQANAMCFDMTDYFNNDIRFARLADRLGVMLISSKGIKASNHPSIIDADVCEKIALSFDGKGASDPDSKEALKKYGREPSGDNEWRISQAEEAFSAAEKTVKYRIADRSDMWYNLTDDKNAPIDTLGYSKNAYYVMQESFKKVTCLSGNTDAVRREGFKLSPVLYGEIGDSFAVTVAVTDEKEIPVDIKTYGDIECTEEVTRLPEWQPNIIEEGYYAVKTIIIKTF